MKKPFTEITGVTLIYPTEIKPIEGYQTPTNPQTGEQFPNDGPFHKSVLTKVNDWFNDLPNSCEIAKEADKNGLFRKAIYSGIALKVVKQLSYTEHQILEWINNNDWYADITQYIDYNVISFGHPAIGLHWYVGSVKFFIVNAGSVIPERKRQALIEYLETYYNNPINDNTNETDLNELYATYQKWLNIFPFEISFFSHLKTQFDEHLPILNSEPEINKYNGRKRFQVHTKSSLIDCLLNLTNTLLTQTNTSTLYEKGLLTEPQKIKIELLLIQRKKKLQQGYLIKPKNEEQQYREILKEWFEDENKFIDALTPLLREIEHQPIPKQKPEPKETETSERIKRHFGFFINMCPRKQKQILNDTDFKKLIEWTIWYFENDFRVPKISEPIEVVNTNKTFVQSAFKYLFKQLHPSSPYPKTLFEFYQSAFKPYSADKEKNFNAVKNNDEVKKLMQINY